MALQRAGSDPKIYKEMLNRQQIPLPYDTYVEEHGIYIMDNDAFALIYECTPLGGYNAESGLTTLLSALPEHAAMQIMLVPSRDITDQVDVWKKNKKMKGEIYEVTRDNYANFIESRSKEIVTPNMRCLACNYKLIVSIIVGGHKKEHSLIKNIFNSIKGIGKDSNEEKEELIKNYTILKESKARYESALTNANLFPRLMTPDMLLKNMYSILNPNHEFRLIPKWGGNEEVLSNNMIANDNVFEVHDDHIVFDGMCGRSLSVKDFPRMWHCAMADILTGEPFGAQSLESTIYYCLNIINEGKDGINKTKRRGQIILSQNLPPELFPKLQMKKQDLADANVQLERGEQIYHINFALFAIGKDYNELQNISGQLKAYYQSIGFKLEEDKYINLPVFLSMLPGNYDNSFRKDLARGRVVFQKNVVDLAPSSADWGGNTANPELFFLTPRGQLFSFDLFASDTNYNAFTIGTSGAGKSVFLQYLAMNYMMSGARINIIDIGGSYENFCGILDGQYVDIKRENPLSLNPFTELTTQQMFDEFKEFLAEWYWMMGAPESLALSQEQSKLIKAYLNQALELSYSKYGIDSDVDTIIESFTEIVSVQKNDGENVIEDLRFTDFLKILSQYGKKGLYGDFFNGKSEIEFKAQIVVLETGSMENTPDLRDPILMILTYHIQKSIYLAKDMSRKNLIIIDEAHKFLGNPKIDGFIEQAYRRFRKHNASMIIGTQGWEDLDSETSPSRAGRVIVENSAFQIIMAQSSASAEKLKKSKAHNFDDYHKQMIDSIKPVKGEYSEAVIINAKNKVKVRIVLDSWMKKIYFTTPQMRTYIRAEVAEGKSFVEAIESMPKELIR